MAEEEDLVIHPEESALGELGEEVGMHFTGSMAIHAGMTPGTRPTPIITAWHETSVPGQAAFKNHTQVTSYCTIFRHHGFMKENYLMTSLHLFRR